MKIKKFSPFLIGSSLLFLGAAHAGSPMVGAQPPVENPGHFYLSLLGGANWVRSGLRETDVTLTAPLATNRYQASRSYRPGPMVGFDLGYQWRQVRDTNVSISLGLETKYSRVLSATGRVRPLFFINPQNDSLDFRYAVSSIPVLVTPRIAWSFPDSPWQPYILAGVGLSWNRASMYQEFPTNPQGTASPMGAPFPGHTELRFAYTAGAGISYLLNSKLELGVEYRYHNYGKARFASSVVQSTPNTLSLGSLSSHGVLLRMTAYF